MIRRAPFVLFLLAIFAGPRTQGGEEETQFIRFRSTAPGQGYLETRVVTYRHPSSRVRLSLVGVVHIGDPGYYSQVQYLLDREDAVLYEGVQGADLEKVGLIGKLQMALGRMACLSYQLDEIDYARPHFVHADITWGDLEQELDRRGLQLLPDPTASGEAGSVIDSFLDQAGGALSQNPSGAESLRYALAQVLSNLDLILEQLRSTPEGSSDDILISVRNRRVMKILKGLLKEAPPRTAAILYGVAHMPNFEHELRGLGFRVESARWLRAWSVGRSTPSVWL